VDFACIVIVLIFFAASWAIAGLCAHLAESEGGNVTVRSNSGSVAGPL
jgi:hypothetical protein